ncbi:MAG: glycoside hydrolase family 3 protein [Treponema sp.]|nr:glycoside hydrolase family 3 protein [Treponema sp.]
MKEPFFFALFFIFSIGGIAASGPEEAAARIAASLDDRILAAQVLLSGTDGRTDLDPVMERIFAQCPPGGVILFRYNLGPDGGTIRRFLGRIAAVVGGAAGLPPLIAVDHEGGSVHRFGAVLTRLPAPASYGAMAAERGREEALAALEAEARRAGGELRELGITLNIAPVAEVLTAENRPFLQDRAYGGESGFVGAAAAAFIRGMAAAGVGCTAKHFPGSAGTDPHDAPSRLSPDREALGALAEPFARIIRTGAPAAIMVSHAVVPALDGERSASLSPAVTAWLREEFGFQGIIMADDFSMAAVMPGGLSPAEAAVRALDAGVDMVMTWPGQIRSVHAGILGALGEGSLSRERLREAAARIIAEKIRLGLIRAGKNPAVFAADEGGSDASR